MVNALNWFEIAVTDIERAKTFYETVMGQSLTSMEMSPGYPMATFDEYSGGGCIIQGEGYTPSTEGAVVYLNCNPNLQEMLDRVEGAGGKVLLPKTAIGENGWMAYILDSEGNKIGLHSSQ
jgi:predicted enzyme related to lactoylglutathione lyase